MQICEYEFTHKEFTSFDFLRWLDTKKARLANTKPRFF